MANPNLQESTPLLSRDRITALEAAVTGDESALFNSTGVTASTVVDIVLTALVTPANVVLSQGGTAATTNYSYTIADCGNGSTFAPTASTQTTTGPATLTTTNYNIISWTGIGGHVYNVYRSASSGTPSTTGFLMQLTAAGAVGSSVAMVFNDTGAISPTGNVPTANTTGSIAVPGPIFSANGVIAQAFNTTALSNAAGQTWTAAQALGRYLIRSGAAGVADVTPTAVALVAGLPGIKVGMGFELTVRNANTGTLTITGGTNVTFTTAITIATVAVRSLFFIFTNVTPGSEAVTVQAGPTTAY